VDAVGRRDLFELLGRLREIPLAVDPPQGMAKLFVPVGADPEDFVGGFPDGVYLAVDTGLVADGSTRLLQLSGHRAALRQLAGRVPDEVLDVPPESMVAFHSPLRDYVRAALEPQIDTIDFLDPEVPFCGGLQPGMYTTADQVSDMFRRNQTDSLSLPLMLDCLERHEVELSVLIGPATVSLYRNAVPHTVVHVENSRHLAEVFGAVQEFGMLPTGP
jgi:[acyl-carrier-protein] S-malonyltransferase